MCFFAETECLSLRLGAWPKALPCTDLKKEMSVRRCNIRQHTRAHAMLQQWVASLLVAPVYVHGVGRASCIASNAESSKCCMCTCLSLHRGPAADTGSRRHVSEPFRSRTACARMTTCAREVDAVTQRLTAFASSPWTTLMARAKP